MLLFGGCAMDSSTDDHRVTKQDYIAKADAICAKVSQADKSISTDTALPDVLRQTEDTFSGGVADLKALDRPAGQDQDLDAWFHDLDDLADAISQARRAADDGDQKPKLNRLFTSIEQLDGKVRRAALLFGFHDCAH